MGFHIVDSQEVTIRTCDEQRQRACHRHSVRVGASRRPRKPLIAAPPTVAKLTPAAAPDLQSRLQRSCANPASRRLSTRIRSECRLIRSSQPPTIRRAANIAQPPLHWPVTGPDSLGLILCAYPRRPPRTSVSGASGFRASGCPPRRHAHGSGIIAIHPRWIMHPRCSRGCALSGCWRCRRPSAPDCGGYPHDLFEAAAKRGL